MPNDVPENPRIQIRSGFRWDRCAAYLFDIDGTLIRSRDRVHANAFAAGTQSVAGLTISLEGVSLAGNTDSAILAEACQRAGLSETFFAQHAEAIFGAMAEYVSHNRKSLAPVVMPGVAEALEKLQNNGALLGVATGNLETIGWIKLTRAGLRNWFRFGGFSDHFLVRNELVAAAAQKARAMLGRAEAEVCVVGDTPRDIAAARSAGLPVIAVATGRFGFDELAALAPDLCATSLADLLAAQAASEQP